MSAYPRLLMPYTFVASGLSDIGLVRENNEDAWAEMDDLSFFALADGMGGHKAGEIASREALAHLLTLVRKAFKGKRRGLEASVKALKQTIVQVNAHVYKYGKNDPLLKGMGTTLCCLYLHEEGAIIGHVGDSRLYRYRKEQMEQLTQDHSLFRELVDLGQLSERQAQEFAYKNIITKAIGTEPLVEPSVLEVDVEPGDTFLLCSDGLSDLVLIQEMKEVLKQDKPVEELVQTFIQMAKDKGAHDNVTVVIVKVLTYEQKDLSR